MLAAQELGDADRQARRHEQGEGCIGAQARGHPTSHARHRNTIQRRCRGSLIGRRNTVFGRVTTPGLPEAKSPCRDDGSGQAATRVVERSQAAITPIRRLADLSSTNPIRRRPCADPGQKQVPGKWITQIGIDLSRPVTEASRVEIENTQVSHHRFTGSNRHSRTRMVLTAYGALSPVIGLFRHHPRCDAEHRHQVEPGRYVRTTRLRRPHQKRSSCDTCRVHRISPQRS